MAYLCLPRAVALGRKLYFDPRLSKDGTVALSKWNRLMITSPKALVRGYPWADTITHELVHPIVESDFPRAPTWIDEGLASLFEAPVLPRPGE